MRTINATTDPSITTYEFAVMCCIAQSEAGVLANELSQYMLGFARMRVSGNSLYKALKRLEEMAYIASQEDPLPAPRKVHGRTTIPKRRLRRWLIINPGRDALASHHRWHAYLWNLIDGSTNEEDADASRSV